MTDPRQDPVAVPPAAPARPQMRLHLPTIAAVREHLAEDRKTLVGVVSPHREVQVALKAADDALAAFDAWLKALATPPCAACAAKAAVQPAASEAAE